MAQAQIPNSGTGPRPASLRVRLTRRAEASVRGAWERAKSEHSSPVRIALSVGVGVFCACTPFIGAHMWIALGLATLFRLNRLWALLGSRFTFGPIFALVAFSEIEIAHFVRTGAWAPLSPAQALAHGRELVVDWALGALVVGGGIAAVATGVAYIVAVSWPAPDAAPPPSSEYPPSGPQDRQP